MTDPLSAALELIRNGIPVFPCNTATKAPLISKEDGGRGHLDATTDETQVRAWWQRFGGNLYWGVPTGRRTGIGVLDVDVDPAKGLDGRQSLVAAGIFPAMTRAHLTPRGGVHLLYMLGTDGDICPTDSGKLGPGLDRRGEGGFVIWYPAHGGTIIEDQKPVAAPEWLLTPAGRGDNGLPRIVTKAEADALMAEWRREAECMVEGERNATLARVAFMFGQMVEVGLCAPDIVGPELVEIGIEAGLSADEASRVVAKGLKRGVEHPGFETADDAASRFFGDPVRWTPRGLLRDFDDLTSQPAPARWLIRGILEEQSLAMLFAEPEAGKSLLTIDWALSIACGREWNGKKVKRGCVVYINGEGSHGMKRRLMAWKLDRGVSPGAYFKMTEKAIPFSDAPSLEALKVEIDALPLKPVLIVVDTVQKMTLGWDDNVGADMSRFVYVAQGLIEKYGCTVLLLHHSGHADKTRGKGSIVIKGAMDSEAGLLTTEYPETVRLISTKMKDAPRFAEIWLVRREVELPWFDDEGVRERSVVVDIIDPPAGKGGAVAGGNGSGGSDTSGRTVTAIGFKATAGDKLMATILSAGEQSYAEARAAFIQGYASESEDARRKAFDRAYDKGVKRQWFADVDGTLTPNDLALARDGLT